MPVVSATGVAVSTSHSDGDGSRAKRVELAMSEAAARAHAAGITDPEEIKARMMVARDACEKGA